jgi:DNA-binding MarR family transcriptional regulator
MTDNNTNPGHGRPKRVVFVLLLCWIVVLSVLLTIPTAAAPNSSNPDSNMVSAASESGSAEISLEPIEAPVQQTSSVTALNPTVYHTVEKTSLMDVAWPADGSGGHQSDWLHADATRNQYEAAPEGETRTRIFELISENPGSHISAVTEESDFHRSTVRYHVHELEKAGLITTSKIQGKRRLFPKGEEDSAAHAVLSDDAAANVLLAIYEDGPVTVSSLANDIDRTASTVSYHLDRLESLRLITRERRGNEFLVSVTPAAAATVRDRAEMSV